MKRKIGLTIIVILVFIPAFSNFSIAFENRPDWLLKSSELPSGWISGSEYEIGEKYYFQVFAPNKDDVYIETIEFRNQFLASEEVSERNAKLKTFSLYGYTFPNVINFSLIDNGFNWQQKTRCCFIRGVYFSFENVVIGISTAKEVSWSDIEELFDYQVMKILNHFGRETSDFLDSNSLLNAFFIISTILGINFIALIFLGVIIILMKVKLKR